MLGLWFWRARGVRELRNSYKHKQGKNEVTISSNSLSPNLNLESIYSVLAKCTVPLPDLDSATGFCQSKRPLSCIIRDQEKALELSTDEQ